MAQCIVVPIRDNTPFLDPVHVVRGINVHVNKANARCRKPASIRFELLSPEEEKTIIPKLEALCEQDMKAKGLSFLSTTDDNGRTIAQKLPRSEREVIENIALLEGLVNELYILGE